jgi:hypothetical protein
VDRLHRHRRRGLRRLEKGHGSDQPFSRGGAAYRAGSDARTDRGVSERGQSGDGSGGYRLVEVYEAFAAEYGWRPDQIEQYVTDEQLAVYAEKYAKRRKAQAFHELDRLVTGTSWGTAIAFDSKGRASRKWQAERRKAHRSTGREKGLTGKALDNAVMALAAADPSLVAFEQRA